ncbi:MAG TPA: ester cyclase [Methanomassiliicoccales archaeon]|nr:ester cyclase [Methanomassiliicoccales archaeon]
MSSDDNKAVVRRVYDELNKGNMAIADELIVDNYAQHSILPVPQGRKGFKEFFASFGKSFPDAHFEVLDIFAEGEKVALRFKATMTHKGEFMGLAPTGRKVSFTGIDIFVVRRGKLVEHWDEVDQLGFLRQLGIVK